MAAGHHDEDEHEHQHDDDHGDDHGHDHANGHGLIGRVRELVAPHSHDSADKVDAELEGSDRGIRALKVSLVGLAATAILQAVIVVFTGSVALLGDTLHNVTDALTALPLWIAFRLGRRQPDRRHTYGWGRAEDVAGVLIVVAILASAAFAGWEAFRRLLDPRDVKHLWAVAGASVIGFIGNEIVARYRITVGTDIGSAALVADGRHARTDGITSLGVLVGAIGTWLGWDRADPVVGLLITVAILVVLRGAARDIYRRLMDVVDDDVVPAIEHCAHHVEAVRGVQDVRVRWIGHTMHATLRITVDPTLDVRAAHAITDDVHEVLLDHLPRLADVVVHVDPADS